VQEIWADVLQAANNSYNMSNGGFRTRWICPNAVAPTSAALARAHSKPRLMLCPSAGDTFRWVSNLESPQQGHPSILPATLARQAGVLQTTACSTLLPHPAPGASVAQHRRVVRPGAGAAAEGPAGGADAQARGHMARRAAGARHQGAPRPFVSAALVCCTTAMAAAGRTLVPRHAVLPPSTSVFVVAAIAVVQCP
jgi:hypothetical protein